MLKKRLLANWNRICPGCTLARKYPHSFIGKKVRAHWEKGCPSHKAYVELFEKETVAILSESTENAEGKGDALEKPCSSMKSPGS